MVEKKAFGRGSSAGGSYGKKPASGGYDRKPREGGYERKPRAEGSSSSYGERKPRAEGGSSFGERKPYVKREGSEGGYAPRAPREGGYERKPRAEGSSFGERKPYVKREGGYDRAPREGGYERKPRAEGSSFGERKPYVKREGGYDRAPREGGYDRAPREGGFDRKPRENWGESKVARFSEKRNIRHDRTPADQKIGRGDGWLVGYHAVLAALSTGRRKVRSVWLLSEAQGELATVLAANPDWNVEIKAKPDFEREFGELVHQGVATLVGNLPQPTLPELLGQMKDKKATPQLIVALDQITDPHNLGAVVRSCAAFGAQGVLVTEHRAAGLNATAAKVAAGAMEVVPVVEVTNLVQSIEMLKEAGYTILGMAGDAETEIGTVAVTGPVCLVMGSEGEGLRRLTREHCDQLVKIAIAPTMESLNVSVATGVALSILTRK